MKIYFVFGDTSLDDTLSLDLPAGSTDAHTDSVSIIDPLKDIDDLFATGSYDGTTKVWSLAKKNLTQNFNNHTAPIYYGLDHVVNSTSLNSFYLVDGSLDNYVNVYSIQTKSGVSEFVGHFNVEQVTSLRIVSFANGRIQASSFLACIALVLIHFF